MAQRTEQRSTETRLLDAAETEFAAKGLHGASLRSIMGAAGTNVAAVHYHFGSKERLLEAVVRRRIADVAAERDRILDEAGEQVGARLLAQAFVRPVLVLVDGGARDWVRLVGRLLDEDDPALAPISEGFFVRNSRFAALLRRLDPSATDRTLGFRLAQAMSTALRVLGNTETAVGLLSAQQDGWSESEVRDELIDVVAAILAGPPAREKEKD